MSKPTWEKEKSHRLPSVLLPGFIKDTEPLRTENSKATWRKCINQGQDSGAAWEGLGMRDTPQTGQL